MAGRSLIITYVGDARSVLAAQGQIDRGHTTMQGTTQKTGGVFQSTFGSLMPIAAAAAGAAVIKFGIDSVKAFSEAEQVMAATNAVLESTGGAANVTAEHVVNLAAKWQELTGVEDDVIQASSNLLLTFRDVVNEVGQGNAIFDQAQVAILDMATAMNQGALPSSEQLKTATIQLGKALNDPIRGMAALTRVGVTFNAAQREQIAAMVESGDTMGAQKLILAELNAEFGGAAKAAGDTFAGSLAKVQAKVDDLQEVLGEAMVGGLTPMLDAMVELAENVAPVLEVAFVTIGAAIEAAAEEAAAIIEPITWLAEHIPDLGAAADESSNLMKVMGDTAKGAFEAMVEGAIPGSQAWFDYRRATEQASDASEEQTSVMDLLSDAAREMRDRVVDALGPLDELRSKHQRAADAAREQRLAVLALSNQFLGIVDSANQVSEAQRELNALERRGREDTKAYEEAVLDALEAQIGLEDAVLSYAEELADSGETARSVKEKIRELGNQFDIQDSIISDLIQQVLAYIRSLNAIPSSVNTAVTTSGGGADVGRHHAQHGFHGEVRRPTVFVAGEAGPERVDISPRGQGAAGVAGVTLNFYGPIVGPGGISEVAELIRRELVKNGIRNVSTGIR